VHRGGASDLGLVLSGATLGMLCLIANVIVSIATDLSERRLHLYPLRYLEQHSGSLGRSFVGDIGSLLILPVIMILLRILPLAGYHAAEHQVVHCIERGELLEPDNIRRMPRVHPRCGTNIAAAAAIFSLALCAGVIGWRTVIGAVAPAALLTFSFWRPLGSFLQQFFTTRPATDKQIRSGMRAARELLTQYRQDCNPPMTLRLRIWRTGLLQMLGGVIAITVLLTALSVFVPAVRPYIPSLF